MTGWVITKEIFVLYNVDNLNISYRRYNKLADISWYNVLGNIQCQVVEKLVTISSIMMKLKRLKKLHFLKFSVSLSNQTSDNKSDITKFVFS